MNEIEYLKLLNENIKNSNNSSILNDHCIKVYIQNYQIFLNNIAKFMNLKIEIIGLPASGKHFFDHLSKK